MPAAALCIWNFFWLNQYIPPMVLEPASLWATTAEIHQFQPAPGPWTLRPFPVLLYSQCPKLLNGQAGGSRGKGQEALICGCDHSAGQGQGCLVWVRLGGDVDSSTVSPQNLEKEKSCLSCFILQYWCARTSDHPFSSLPCPQRQTRGPALFFLVSSMPEKWLFADKMCQHFCSKAGAAHMAKEQPRSAPFLLPVTDVAVRGRWFVWLKRAYGDCSLFGHLSLSFPFHLSFSWSVLSA